MTDDRSFRLEGIDHVAFAVRSVRRSVAWYCDVLGFERRFEEEWGDFPAIVGIGSTMVAFFPQRKGSVAFAGSPRGGFLHLAFRADRPQFDRARTGLADRGVAVEFQDHGASHSIYFADPDGHRLEITTYEV